MECQVLTLEEAAALARCGVDCLHEFGDAGRWHGGLSTGPGWLKAAPVT